MRQLSAVRRGTTQELDRRGVQDDRALQLRDKLRKATYTCTEVKEYYQPCYVTRGITVMSARFAKHLERYPDIQNFMWDRDPLAIGATD